MDTNRAPRTFTFHDSVNESKEWYTPRNILDAIGIDFDLDPASSDKANTIIRAKNYYTIKDDGLKQNWYGNVWLNPPYGTDVPIWLKKALEENKKNNANVMALIFSRTDTLWFHNYAVKFDKICFLKGRISFIKAETMEQGTPSGAGSMIVSIGEELNQALVNANLGFCVDTRN